MYPFICCEYVFIATYPTLIKYILWQNNSQIKMWITLHTLTLLNHITQPVHTSTTPNQYSTPTTPYCTLVIFCVGDVCEENVQIKQMVVCSNCLQQCIFLTIHNKVLHEINFHSFYTTTKIFQQLNYSHLQCSWNIDGGGWDIKSGRLAVLIAHIYNVGGVSCIGYWPCSITRRMAANMVKRFFTV